ncbi:MAG: hypothetical protein RL701_5757 [Pseudomonadota bacterium]
MIMPLLGPALVLYLLADVAASRGNFGPSDYGLAAVVVLLALFRRYRPAHAHAPAASLTAAEVHAEGLLRWLSLSTATALLGLFSGHMQRLSVEMAETAALAVLGACVFELALNLPDAWGPPRYRQTALVVSAMLAIASALAACLALGPEFHWLGRLWLVPALYARATAAYACLTLFAALGIRLARRRVVSARELSVMNTYALAGLAPAVLFAAACVFGARHVPALVAPWLVRVAAGSAAAALCFGHRQLLTAPRALTISNSTRDALALALGLAVTTAAVAFYPAPLPHQPLARAATMLGSLLCALAVYSWLRSSFRRVLAPDSGRLLAALAYTERAVVRAQTLETLVTAVLGGLRRAQGIDNYQVARPLLYNFDPLFEGHSDAAGAAHLQLRAPHPLIVERLRGRPTDLIIRSELEQQIVRQPTIRPLLEAVLEHDLLCIVPLSIENELEGAVYIPRGERTALLTQEEQLALQHFARHLSGVLVVFTAKARAEQRANQAVLAASHAQAEIERLTAQVAALSADRALLHDQRATLAEAPPLVAYSAPARALVARCRELAAQPAPVLFISEPGMALEPLARLLHDRGPFIAFDCAAVRAEQAEAALFGGAGPFGVEVGCMRAAESGTLLLLDLPALPPAVQSKLAWALANGRALQAGASASYALATRIVASARTALDTLEAAGQFASDLAQQLAPVVCRVPPLRECADDIVSLLLLSLDRACRRQGRGPLGIEPEALSVLRNYDFPGNHAELDHIIDRAAQRARGVRLTIADFAVGRVLPDKSDTDLWSAPLEEIERKVLLNALGRAGGNKSEAARLLGVPRSTLADKLRRHKLEEHTKPAGPRLN